MDLQRSLLIGAIAVLSFMLLTEWVAFKDDKTAVTTQQTSRLIGNGAESATELPDPIIEPSATAEDDLPTAPDAIGTTAQQAEVTVVDSGRIVQVYTDVLQLAIDLQGGDIIELSLPKFLEKQDNPDNPFVLLEQNDQLIYIAPERVDRQQWYR